MISEVPLWRRIEEAILVDEIGIEAGRSGQYVLKAAYRPVFRNLPRRLVPWGVCGSTVPHLHGQPAAADAAVPDAAPEEASFAQALSSVLHLRNHRHLGVAGLALVFSFDPRAICGEPGAPGQVEGLMRVLEDAEVAPELLVCEVAQTVEESAAEDLAAALRQRGLKVAMGGFGAAPSVLTRLGRIDPEMVRLDEGWFRRIAEEPRAAALLAPLVDALQREGREVVVDGLKTPAHLRLALDAGVDLLAGDVLRPAALAGALIDTSTLDPAPLTTGGGKVLPLFAGRSRGPG